MRHLICQPLKLGSQIYIVAILVDCPHNIQWSIMGTTTKDESIWPSTSGKWHGTQSHTWSFHAIGCKYINRNNVVCNHSLCNYVWLNVVYKYKWLLMWLLFKFGLILVFQLGCNYELFHFFNRLNFHDVFVFFTKSYIHLVAHATKIITL
jgi:hypothetical protein